MQTLFSRSLAESFRVGQKCGQKRLQFTTLETYDQVLQAKNAMKMIAQIGATSKIVVTDEDKARLMSDPVIDKRLQTLTNPKVRLDKVEDNVIKGDKVRELYR